MKYMHYFCVTFADGKCLKRKMRSVKFKNLFKYIEL